MTSIILWTSLVVFSILEAWGPSTSSHWTSSTPTGSWSWWRRAGSAVHIVHKPRQGKFVWTVTSMGLKTSLSTFSRLMEYVLKGFHNAVLLWCPVGKYPPLVQSGTLPAAC